MKDAGFEYGIGLANNILIDLIKDHPDVYAAKLTGAGGGGCVFALVNPQNIERVFQDWQERLKNIISNETSFKNKFCMASIAFLFTSPVSLFPIVISNRALSMVLETAWSCFFISIFQLRSSKIGNPNGTANGS